MPRTTACEAFRSSVREIMDENGITITWLADAANMARPGLSRVLSGDEGISMERAERIATALNTTLAALLIGKKLSKVAS